MPERQRWFHRIPLPPWVLGVVLAMPGLAHAAGASSLPLGEVPEPGGYTSWIRILIVLLMLLPWLSFCQWVDKDAVYVRRINREMWNGIVLGGGLVGIFIWLLLPWHTAGLFAAGFGLWFVITFGTCAVYVIVRNGMVDPTARVFTPRHIQMWFSSMGKKKEERREAIERVKLTKHDGGKVPVPDDPAQAEPFEAAQQLLFDALWRRATDVDLLVGANNCRLAYRIDGFPTGRDDLLDRDNAERALIFIKQVAGLDISERRRPQTGSMSAALKTVERGTTEIEVRSSGTTQYERLTMRIIAQETKLRMHDLGMSSQVREKLAEAVQQNAGLFLISGPKASGVTTTLYAALRDHDAFMQNLLTLENDPLMDLENITQHIYDPDKHEGSYPRQLQTVLRKEPDVVMVSDCADRETAHLAAKASQNHRIYMGIQAKDTFEALKKLLSLAGDTDTVASVLRVVTCQRLVRKLCVACRIAYKPDAQLLRKANLPADKIEHFYRPPRPEEMIDEKGNPRVCPNCQNSCYYGRTGLFELLVINDPIRELIRKGHPMTAIKAEARKTGMLYLQEVGLQKVISGETGMTEVLRVLRDEDNGGARSAARKEG